MPRTGPLLLALFLALLPACTSPIIEGDLLSLEPARAPKSAATLTELLPWATATNPKPSPLESESPEGEFTTRYEVLEGDNTGSVMLQVRAPGLSPTSWFITRRVEGEPTALEERFQTIDARDGSLVLPYSLNFERGVRVDMDPAPITVPARIEPGDTLTRELKIRLPLLEDPKRLREKGTAISEFNYVGDQRIHTAAGVFETKHLREVFTSRFSAASAIRTIDRWYAPGQGLIAERWSEEVTVLGIVIERTKLAIRVLPPRVPETGVSLEKPTEIESPEPQNATPGCGYLTLFGPTAPFPLNPCPGAADVLGRITVRASAAGQRLSFS
jgi:hypothetical protein